MWILQICLAFFKTCKRCRFCIQPWSLELVILKTFQAKLNQSYWNKVILTHPYTFQCNDWILHDSSEKGWLKLSNSSLNSELKPTKKMINQDWLLGSINLNRLKDQIYLNHVPNLNFKSCKLLRNWSFIQTFWIYPFDS